MKKFKSKKFWTDKNFRKEYNNQKFIKCKNCLKKYLKQECNNQKYQNLKCGKFKKSEKYKNIHLYYYLETKNM